MIANSNEYRWKVGDAAYNFVEEEYFAVESIDED
jgi:hypothetical protein